MCPKKSAATRSAAEQQELGWPLPAAVVASMESMRNWLAMPDKVSSIVIFIFVLCNCMASWTKGKREKSGGNFFNGTLCVLLLSRAHSTPFRTPGKVIVNVNFGDRHQYW